VNGNAELLARGEAIRAHGALAMGLVASVREASESRLHTPKIAFVSPPRAYQASSGQGRRAADIDSHAAMLSMGQMHHAITGTGAVAMAVACAIPGTVPQRILAPAPIRWRRASAIPRARSPWGPRSRRDGETVEVERAVMSRSARRLMEGWVRVPSESPAA
jgi:2-methylaconitate cis-trans-isomerase PrpF